MVLLLISVTATVPGMAAWGREQHQQCSRPGAARATAAAGPALACQLGEATQLLGSFCSPLAAVWLLFPS